jgi:hypothetical protein
MECDNEVPITARTSQTVSFTQILKTFDVEVFICTGCYMAGGLSKKRIDEIVRDLADAQKGYRW